jgi:toxin ParE1/3/4
VLTRRVILLERALADIEAIHDFIERDSPANARRFVQRVEAFCLSLGDFPERGTKREDLGAGIRVLGFKRRVTIIMAVSAETVEVLRVLYGGRDFERLLRMEPF